MTSVDLPPGAPGRRSWRRGRSPASRRHGRPTQRRQVHLPGTRQPPLRRDGERARHDRGPRAAPRHRRRSRGVAGGPARARARWTTSRPATIRSGPTCSRPPRTRSSSWRTPATWRATCRSPSRAGTSACRWCSPSNLTDEAAQARDLRRRRASRPAVQRPGARHLRADRRGRRCGAGRCGPPRGRPAGRQVRRQLAARDHPRPGLRLRAGAAPLERTARCWRRSRGRSVPPPCWSRSRPACSAGSSRRAAARRSAWRRLLEPARWAVAARWAAQVERRRDVPEPFADRLARWATSPWPGIPAFLVVSVAMFLAVIYVGGWLAAVLGAAWGATVSPFLATAVPAIVPVPVLAELAAVGARRRHAGHARRRASPTSSRSTSCSRPSRTPATSRAPPS